MADYTIQSGDTLSKIAKTHGTTVEQLVKANGISNPNEIKAGQILVFEPTEKTQTQPQAQPQSQSVRVEEEMTGLDSFQREETEPTLAQTYAPLAYGLGGAALWQTGKVVMPAIKSGTETMLLRGMYAQDAAKQGIRTVTGKGKQTASAVRNFIAQKGKHAAKSAELHYAFGKDAVQKAGKKAVQKAKVGARYTRFVGNTKIAPKLIKGATKWAGPLAALYGAYEVKQAYDEGGEKAAVKQAIKTGGGLAGGWAGAKAGAALGSFAGPIGTVAGGIIGGIAGYLIGEKLFS